jgi:hypothetical protein
MKTGDRVKIQIRREKKNHFCDWLYNGVQNTMGTIEKEYPADMKNTGLDEYEWLVKFDNPPVDGGNRGEFKRCWFNHKDLKAVTHE